MKFSKLLVVAFAAAAMQSYGFLSTTNAACRIAVNSSTTNTIISLATVNFGIPETTSMNATNYVLTAGLSNGDKLYQQNGRSFNVWEVEDGKWAAKGTSATVGSESWPAAGDAELSRGSALILWRSDPASNGGVFYLAGQYTEASGTCAAATGSSAGVWTLMSNASITNVPLNSLRWSVEPSVGDMIKFISDEHALGTIDYSWRTVGGENCWATNTFEEVNLFGETFLEPTGYGRVGDEAVIPAGTGFWYVNKNSKNPAPTIQW